MANAEGKLSILIQESDDMPGVWTAHCLDWDVISHGGSEQMAVSNLLGALCVVAEDDIGNGLNPGTRKPAPHAFWVLYNAKADPK